MSIWQQKLSVVVPQTWDRWLMRQMWMGSSFSQKWSTTRRGQLSRLMRAEGTVHVAERDRRGPKHFLLTTGRRTIRGKWRSDRRKIKLGDRTYTIVRALVDYTASKVAGVLLKRGRRSWVLLSPKHAVDMRDLLTLIANDSQLLTLLLFWQ